MKAETEKTEDKNELKVPRGLKRSVFVINFLIAGAAFLSGYGIDEFKLFATILGQNIVLIPLVSVVVGLGLKQLDKSFRLENMYYLGLFLSIVLTIKGFR